MFTLPTRAALPAVALFGGLRLRLSRKARNTAARQTMAVFNPPEVTDPNGTKRIIDQYQKILAARWARMRLLTRQSILESGIESSVAMTTAVASGGKKIRISMAVPDKAGAELFGWFTRTGMGVMLDAAPDAQVVTTSTFLLNVNRQAVSKAAILAFQRARAVGIETSFELSEFVRLVRSDTPADILATRQFALLRDVTFDAGDVIRDELVAGLRSGRTAEQIAQTLDGKLKSFNLTRLRTIARTEITNATAEATLNSFSRLGIKQVQALVEFTLNVNGSAQPCPLCEVQAGQVRTVAQARGVIPVHANCQCGWVPVSTIRA